MDAEHLESAHQLVSNKWQGVLVDLSAFQAVAMPFPIHIFNETFLEKIDPYVWCLCIKKSHKDTYPELGNLALRILNLPASSASIERIFSNFSFIQTKLRNRQGLEKAAKLAICYRELRGTIDFDWG